MRRLLLAPLLLLACNAPAPAPQTPAKMPASAAPAPAAAPTTDSKNVSPDWEIVPGKRIGHTALGDDPETLLQRLGRPDASDAAMGKAWLAWDGKNTDNTLAVFTTYADSNMQRKAIRQIRITSPRFQTAEGLHTTSRLPEIQRAFPALKAGATDATHGAPARYDAVAAGISFECSGHSQKDSCTAILIYPPDESPTAYLPIPH